LCEEGNGGIQEERRKGLVFTESIRAKSRLRRKNVMRLIALLQTKRDFPYLSLPAFSSAIPGRHLEPSPRCCFNANSSKERSSLSTFFFVTASSLAALELPLVPARLGSGAIKEIGNPKNDWGKKGAELRRKRGENLSRRAQ